MVTRRAGTSSSTPGAPAGLGAIVAEQEWQDLLRQASHLRKGGRLDGAIAAYQRLLALKPDLPESWYNLGLAATPGAGFRRLRSPPISGRSISASREPEEVHLNRAVIYADHLHQPEKAEREIDAALEKNPVLRSGAAQPRQRSRGPG